MCKVVQSLRSHVLIVFVCEHQRLFSIVPNKRMQQHVVTPTKKTTTLHPVFFFQSTPPFCAALRVENWLPELFSKVPSFQATNYILYGMRLVTCHPVHQENGGDACSGLILTLFRQRLS